MKIMDRVDRENHDHSIWSGYRGVDQLFNCSHVAVAIELIMEPIYLDHLNPLICHGSGNTVWQKLISKKYMHKT